MLSSNLGISTIERVKFCCMLTISFSTGISDPKYGLRLITLQIRGTRNNAAIDKISKDTSMI